MLIHSNSWIFQDAVTTAGNGSVFYSGPNDQLTVYITGTSSNLNVVFEGCDNSNNWYTLPAIKLSDLTTVWSTTSKGAYVLNLALYVGVRCRVSAVSGGTLSIIGRIVNSGTSLISNKDAQVTGSKAADVTFHNGATATADGTVLTVDGQKSLLVSIARTAGSSTVSFIGVGGNGADIPIMGINLSTLATATSTTGTGELWQFDITGLVAVKMKLTAIVTGPITVKGRAVA